MCIVSAVLVVPGIAGSLSRSEERRVGIAFSFCDVEEVPYLKDIQKLIGKEVPVAGGHIFETAEVKEAIAGKKKAIKEESKRRNMFGSKRDGSFWRNKKRAAAK